MFQKKSVRKVFLAIGALILVQGCNFTPNAKKESAPQLPQLAAAGGNSADRILENDVPVSTACDARKDDPRFNQLVDSSYYLRRNADVRAQVLDGRTTAVSHFLCYGQYERRKPNMLYDEAAYLFYNNDVNIAVSRGTFRTGFEHFALYGQREGRPTMNFIPIWNTPRTAPGERLFSEAFYLQGHPGVRALVDSGQLPSAFAHFIQTGQKQAFTPSRYWNEYRYRNLNPDVKVAVQRGELNSGLEHYLSGGEAQDGRLPFAADMFTSPGSARTGLEPKVLSLASGQLMRVLRSETRSGNVEAEILSAEGRVLNRYVTPFDLIGAVVCDFQTQRDDLSCVLPTPNAESGFVEVHTLTRTSGYSVFSQHQPTAITLDDAPNFNWRFRGEDLVAIKRNNVESGFVEMHILTKASGYQQFSVQVATPINSQDGLNFRFLMVGDDLVGLKVQNAESGTTEIHVLSGASTYSVFTLHSASGLIQPARRDEHFVMTPDRDLIVITGHTEGDIQISRRLRPGNGYLN